MMTENRMTCLVVGLVVMGAYQAQQWWSGDRLVECPTPPAAPAACTPLDLLALREPPAPPARCRLAELRAAARDAPLASLATTVLLLLSALKAGVDVWRERRARAACLADEPERARRRRSLAEYTARRAAAAGAGCDQPARLTLLQLTEPFLASRRAASPPPTAGVPVD